MMNIYRFAELTFSFRRGLAYLCRHLVELRKINLIIVFGMSRSGTTFLAESLALDKANALYIHEPVKRMLQTRHKQSQGDTREFWEAVFQPDQIPLKVHYLVCVVFAALMTGRVKKGGTLCIKPISLVDGMQETSAALDCSMVYISRHPCGWVDSINRQSLHDSERHRAKIKFDAAKLHELGDAWGERNRSIKELFAKNPHWVWIVFEELCANPVENYRILYRRLNIDWSEEVEMELKKRTSTPSEDFYGTNRNSIEQIDKWKRSLSPDEIEAIRSGCIKHNTGVYEGF